MQQLVSYRSLETTNRMAHRKKSLAPPAQSRAQSLVPQCRKKTRRETQKSPDAPRNRDEP